MIYEFTKELALEIIKLYNDHKSFYDISEKLDTNSRIITAVFEKYNIKPRNNTENLNKHKWKEHNNNLLNSEQEIVDLYLSGVSEYELKDRFKTSRGKIFSILNKYEVIHEPDNVIKKDILNMHLNNKSIFDIQSKYKMSSRDINKIINNKQLKKMHIYVIV